MNNVIFGSGIVGLLAKMILGDSWKIVPFYQSRFFSFNPALDDNFIIRNDKLDPFLKDLLRRDIQQFLYKRSWSIGGQLVKSFDNDLCADWSQKVFGSEAPPQIGPYFNKKLDYFIYDIKVNQLYSELLSMHMADLKSNVGKVTEVGDHYYIQDGQRHDFDNAVNTIPLYAMCNLMNVKHNLPSKTIHYLHIKTDNLDFEGANQVLVVDRPISFYKVTNLAPGRYLFYLHEELPNPGVYLMAFMRDFDILDGTSLHHALPMGAMPKLNWLEDLGVYSVGSYAQWDWCMDVGSCILRLLNYSSRGFKPFRKEIKL